MSMKLSQPLMINRRPSCLLWWSELRCLRCRAATDDDVRLFRPQGLSRPPSLVSWRTGQHSFRCEVKLRQFRTSDRPQGLCRMNTIVDRVHYRGHCGIWIFCQNSSYSRKTSTYIILRSKAINQKHIESPRVINTRTHKFHVGFF
jgi:hypothetical protein